MDLHYSQTVIVTIPSFLSFTTLWIYTILKRVTAIVLLLLVFYYLMDLHYSQTIEVDSVTVDLFYYLMDLHYSQTRN